MLDDIHAQHAFQAYRRTAVARLRVARLDHLAQRSPGNDLLHRRQEGVAPGQEVVQLLLRVVVSCHGKNPLLHARFNAGDVSAVDLNSVALTQRRAHGKRGPRAAPFRHRVAPWVNYLTASFAAALAALP